MRQAISGLSCYDYHTDAIKMSSLHFMALQKNEIRDRNDLENNRFVDFG